MTAFSPHLSYHYLSKWERILCTSFSIKRRFYSYFNIGFKWQDGCLLQSLPADIYTASWPLLSKTLGFGHSGSISKADTPTHIRKLSSGRKLEHWGWTNQESELPLLAQAWSCGSKLPDMVQSDNSINRRLFGNSWTKMKYKLDGQAGWIFSARFHLRHLF